MQISIFGSASPKPGDPVYEQARELGFLLGKAGHTILTGGYAGTMEGASRGAAEAGAHVIGSPAASLKPCAGRMPIHGSKKSGILRPCANGCMPWWIIVMQRSPCQAGWAP